MHSKQIPSGNVFILSGKCNFLSFVHEPNAYSPISVTSSGILITLSLSHSEKPATPICFTLYGSCIDVNAAH